MSNRKPISNKIRFEIFKRDSFTCQYCGKKAPDIVLEIDHITPVKHRGKNDILNLITSCFECNSGKSDRKLSDNHLIDKSRVQIEELQERKNQLEMLLQWKTGLSTINEDMMERVIDYFNSKFDEFHLSENGEKKIRGYVKKHNVDKVINAIDEACLKYLYTTPTMENFEFILSRVKHILLFNEMSPEKQADWKRTSEVLRKCKAKFYGYFDYNTAVSYLKNYLRCGNSIEELEEITTESTTFGEWKNSLDNV